MHICFAVYSKHQEALQDPEYCETNPLGGTETAVIKLVAALRRLGVRVTLVTTPPHQLEEVVDVYVSTRVWQPFLNDERLGKLQYLWCHDDVDQPLVKRLMDPAVGSKVYGNCNGVILVSNFQASQWIKALKVPPEKIFITSNGVDLHRFKIDRSLLSQREPHAYYSSTPYRGLANLLDYWPVVRTVLGERARLKVCSSLQVYGAPEEEQYLALYEKARQMEGVDYIGSIGQKQLREVAASCRALAYPCIFPETGCIAAMEAMASGCVVVSTALGALTETAWRNPLVPLGPYWGDLWIEALIRTLADHSYYEMIARENLYLAELMGWDAIAKKWLMRFHSDTVKQAAQLSS